MCTHPKGSECTQMFFLPLAALLIFYQSINNFYLSTVVEPKKRRNTKLILLIFLHTKILQVINNISIYITNYNITVKPALSEHPLLSRQWRKSPNLFPYSNFLSWNSCSIYRAASTVGPLLRGHPRDWGNCPLNRDVPWMEVRESSQIC